MRRLLCILTAFFIFMSTAVSAAASCNVATIMYHNITNDSSRWDDYCISPEQLESDIAYFLDRGYVSITASELASEKMSNLNGKNILLLTFDDGYEGWYTYAYPILKKYNAKATMFLVGAKVNHYGYLSEYQIKELADCGLVEIGNHTDKIHQAPLELVKWLYNDNYTFWDIISDVQTNAEKIEAVTNKKVTSLSWPYGYYTSALDSAVKDAGYKITFSTNYGVDIYNGSVYRPFNRINREHSITSEELYRRVESSF